MILVAFVAVTLITQQDFTARKTYDSNSCTFIDCTFTDCSTTANGGAVYFVGASAVLNFSDCSFSRCVSEYGSGIYSICASFFTQRLSFSDCSGHASMSFEAHCATTSQNNCTLSVNPSGRGRDTYTIGGSCMYNQHNCTGISAVTGTILRRDECATVVDKYLSISDAYTVVVLTFSTQTVSDSRYIWLNNITSSSSSTAIFELNSIDTLEVHDMYLTNSNLISCHHGTGFTSACLYDCYLDIPSPGSLSASGCLFDYTGPIPSHSFSCDGSTAIFTPGRSHIISSIGLLFVFAI